MPPLASRHADAQRHPSIKFRRQCLEAQFFVPLAMLPIDYAFNAIKQCGVLRNEARAMSRNRHSDQVNMVAIFALFKSVRGSSDSQRTVG